MTKFIAIFAGRSIVLPAVDFETACVYATRIFGPTVHVCAV